jgi:hypothetical protein
MRARERAGIWLFSLYLGRPSAEGGTPRSVVFKRVDDFHDYHILACVITPLQLYHPLNL